MVRVNILSSKRLSRSFKKVDGMDVWESMAFELDEALEIIDAAIRRLTEDSEPLTITIAPIERLK